MESVSEKIEKLLCECDELAIKEVETLARTILIKNPKKTSQFVMAMGTFFFTDKKGEIMNDWIADKLVDYKKLEYFIRKWDTLLKITGTPMRFTATGPKITDW